MLHVFDDHSSIRKTVVFDFVCLSRQFETRLLVVSHLLHRAPPSAATSNPRLWLPPVPPQTNACCSQAGRPGRPLCYARFASSRAHAFLGGGFSELLCGAPLSSHSIQSSADGWRCLPPARHRHCTFCKQRAAGLECSLFIIPVTVCYIAVLYDTFHWFYNIIQHAIQFSQTLIQHLKKFRVFSHITPLLYCRVQYNT